jgi:DNA-binding transcriptional LysR family regulator
MQNVTLRQLEAFLAVAEELHFGRAAERLSVSAPWMSHTVRDLERALRVELLSRTTRTVQVTPAGQVFAGLASQILTELSSAIKTVRNMSAAPRETLKLGYTIGAGLEVVPTLLRTYAARGPDAGIQTEEFDFTDPSAGLRDNLVNAAVVRPPLGLPGLVSVELATERRVACLPDDHPLAARESLSVSDVLPEPIVAAPGSPGPVGLLDPHRLPVRAGAGGRGGQHPGCGNASRVPGRWPEHHVRSRRCLVQAARRDLRADP